MNNIRLLEKIFDNKECLIEEGFLSINKEDGICFFYNLKTNTKIVGNEFLNIKYLVKKMLNSEKFKNLKTMTFLDELDFSSLELDEIPLNVISPNLNLSNNNIKEIPVNYKQNGWLNLSNNQIKEIPTSFQQSGNLILSGNNISKIPDHYIQKGLLSVSFNNIEKFPIGFIQDNSLDLIGNKIIAIPECFVPKNHVFLKDNQNINIPLILKENDFLHF